MARFLALIDASALFSIRVTNLSLEIAKSGVFQPRWSQTIHDEWRQAVQSSNPATDPARLAARQGAMDRAFPDALINSNYQPIDDSLTLPDPKDRHVLAAAIVGRCDVIVTFNLKDFPSDIVGRFRIDVQHPDEFLLHQLTLAPPEVVAAARAVRRRLHSPSTNVVEFLEGLRRAGLPMVADALVEHAAYL